jgi:hypothetical protein
MANALGSDFNLKVLIQMLIEWIVVTDQPFTVVEHPLFRAILSYLRPELVASKGFSDSSISHNIMNNFLQMRTEITKKLEVCSD